TILRIVKEFGGDFSVEYAENAEKLIINKKREGFSIVHLTVYGKGVLEKIKEIRKEKNLLIVVGGAKVEPVFYELADFNISVTNQPHSEVASLAIILDKYFNEKEFSLDFKNAKRKIIGVEKGKKIDLMQSN
ncbi:tRNA (cytidine(56)-2'-O)-methyltransferase, partial [Candidatus Woesearchaeota archaeon]|nr:tRNA (cytidine(56)-2'-O)-methyltransferase [Candidatus Woesearchaeota archaeon]